MKNKIISVVHNVIMLSTNCREKYRAHSHFIKYFFRNTNIFLKNCNDKININLFCISIQFSEICSKRLNLTKYVLTRVKELNMQNMHKNKCLLAPGIINQIPVSLSYVLNDYLAILSQLTSPSYNYFILTQVESKSKIYYKYYY